MSITREDFIKYVEVQKSGLYNMFDPRARKLANLSRSKWVEIMSQYDRYNNKYKGEDNESKNK